MWETATVHSGDGMEEVGAWERGGLDFHLRRPGPLGRYAQEGEGRRRRELQQARKPEKGRWVVG